MIKRRGGGAGVAAQAVRENCKSYPVSRTTSEERAERSRGLGVGRGGWGGAERVFYMYMFLKRNNRTPPNMKNLCHPHSIFQVPAMQLTKMSIDPKFVELTADVLEIFFVEEQDFGAVTDTGHPVFAGFSSTQGRLHVDHSLVLDKLLSSFHTHATDERNSIVQFREAKASSPFSYTHMPSKACETL